VIQFKFYIYQVAELSYWFPPLGYFFSSHLDSLEILIVRL